MEKQKAPGRKPKKQKKRVPKSARERLFAVLKAACAILVVLALVVIAAQRFGNVTFSSVGDWVDSLVSGLQRGDGYPYYFEDSSVLFVEPIGSDLLVVTEHDTYVLDKTARRTNTLPHTYTAPYADSRSGRVLFLDVGGTTYRIQSKSRLLYEGTSAQRLLTGAIAENGAVALASRGENAQSMLTVLDSRQQEVFRWNCAAETIVAVGISDRGKRAAAAVLGAENGELYTKVHLFDFDYNEPIASFTFPEPVSGIVYLAEDRVLLTGERVFALVEDGQLSWQEDLSLNTLSAVCTSEDGMTAAVFSKYGSSAVKIIRAYNDKGEQLFETELAEPVKNVSCDGRHVSVLTDSFLYQYDRGGTVVGQATVDADSIRPFTDGRKTYVYVLGGVRCYDTTEMLTENAES